MKTEVAGPIRHGQDRLLIIAGKCKQNYNCLVNGILAKYI